MSLKPSLQSKLEAYLYFYGGDHLLWGKIISCSR
jgi:hypothetical protein